jgi:signal transduction histidine kinase
MPGSLRVRLLVAMILVSGVAVAVAGFLFARTARLEFQRREVANEETSLERLGTALERHYREAESWEGVSSTLAQLGALSGQRLVLAAPDGALVGVWPESLDRAEIAIGPNHTLSMSVDDGQIVDEFVLVNSPHADIRAGDGTLVGTLYPMPAGHRAGEAFADSLVRPFALLVAAIFATVLVATYLLSRRVLGPIETLTSAVRRMERGDLSQRVEARSGDEIGELAGAFNSMAETIARAERLRRDLVNDVAHELRTPLTNIRCQVEAIQDGLVVADDEALASLHEEVMHLNRLIDDLRDLSLAEAGRLSLDRQPVAVADAVQSAVSALRPRATAGGLALDVRVARDLPPVEADPVRLGQILRNLLDNAAAHTPPGGTIRVSAEARDGAVEITVGDTGSGIAAEHLPRVFERFYRTDPSRTRATGGAGLGLAIVKQLAEAHGGAVRVESDPGRGSAFTVTLPKC